MTRTVETAYLYDDTAPNYADIGPVAPVCNTGPAGGCAVSLEVTEAGAFRWILAVSGERGQTSHIAAKIAVPPPDMRVAISGGGSVDPLQPEARGFSWTTLEHSGNDAGLVARGWVEMQRTGSYGWSSVHYPPSGPAARFQIPRAEFESGSEVTYRLRHCQLQAGSEKKFCSPFSSVSYKPAYDQFRGPKHLHVRSGQDLDIGFTTDSGNLRLLSSTTLIPRNNGRHETEATGSQYRIDGNLLTPGEHRLELNACVLPDGHCSHRVMAERALFDGSFFHLPADVYEQGEVIAVLLSGWRGPIQQIRAPVTGPVEFLHASEMGRVQAGEPLAYSLRNPGDVLYVLVDSPEQWDTNRDYRQDFRTAETYQLQGFGEALDVTFGPDGTIWLINEFSNNVERVSADGEASSLNLPLARHRIYGRGVSGLVEPRRNRAVRPFTFWPIRETAGRTSISSLAEEITASDSIIWLTQGGGFQPGTRVESPNHSRIVSYNPAGRDSPATAFDDRFCIYNMPTDDPQGFGNNQVIGIALAGGRVWVAESRGFFNEEPSLVSSFIPHPEQCENLLNFDDPEAVAAQDLQYCGEGRTPEQDRCMEKHLLPNPQDNVKVAHLKTDPVDQSIWFTDAHGRFLGHLDPHQPTGFQLYNFIEAHKNLPFGVPGLGGLPWSLVVDREAVYIAEYATRHILRFDKATATFHEIHVPYEGRELNLHSLAVDPMRDRLWFTLVNEHGDPTLPGRSTIGYVDLDSWRSYLEDPDRGRPIAGTVYSGLDSVPPTGPRHYAPQGFRGIAVDARSGKIAVATMHRNQLTLLTPAPGFWP